LLFTKRYLKKKDFLLFFLQKEKKNFLEKAEKSKKEN